MKLNKLLVMALAGSLFFASCTNDDDATDTPKGVYDNGVFVLNQGGFGHGDAKVSFISDAFVLENNIFETNNPSQVLGDTGQDMAFNGDLAYIVLNYSNKIEVVNRYTFAHVTSIESGLSNPRYIAFADGKGYITNWGAGNSATDDYVAVLNVATNAITKMIPVAEGPERIIENKGKLYVSHYGGFSYGHTVSVINAETNALQTTINVGDAPRTMAVKDNRLYVLNEGLPSWSGAETSGSLSVINLTSNTVTGTIAFDSVQHPSNLVVNEDKVYYTSNSDIGSFTIANTDLPAPPHAIFSTTDQGVYGVYSFAIKDGHVYVGDAGDYASNGKVYIYSLTGALQNTFTVGIIPAGFYFND